MEWRRPRGTLPELGRGELAEAAPAAFPCAELHVPLEGGASEQTMPRGHLTSGRMAPTLVAQGQPLPRAAREGRGASVCSTGKMERGGQWPVNRGSSPQRLDVEVSAQGNSVASPFVSVLETQEKGGRARKRQRSATEKQMLQREVETTELKNDSEELMGGRGQNATPCWRAGCALLNPAGEPASAEPIAS